VRRTPLPLTEVQWHRPPRGGEITAEQVDALHGDPIPPGMRPVLRRPLPAHQACGVQPGEVPVRRQPRHPRHHRDVTRGGHAVQCQERQDPPPPRSQLTTTGHPSMIP
jgi:hypothetical protein